MFLSFHGYAQSGNSPHIHLDSLQKLRLCVIKAAQSQTFVTETRNRNDHPQVDVYFKACGHNSKKYPWRAKAWCVAFVVWSFEQCLDLKKTIGRSLVSFTAVASWNNLKTFIVPRSQPILPADVVTYRSFSHGEFVQEWPSDPNFPVFYTTGGNTAAGRPSHGVYTRIPRRKIDVKNIIRIIK